MLTDFVKIPGL